MTNKIVTSSGMVIESITVPLDANEQEIFAAARHRLKKIGAQPGQFSLRLFRRSVDARDRASVQFVYSVLATCASGAYPTNEKLLQKYTIRMLQAEQMQPEYGTDPIQAPPLVVGMGPAGLFATLRLAENGYRPVIIDRGESVTDPTLGPSGMQERLNC